MRDFGKAITHLQLLRRKFEGLLDAARKKADHARRAHARRGTHLEELTGFGENPGNLRMRIHVPAGLAGKAPLVVALHGCSQSADEYDYGTGWSTLADRLGFAVVYPEQQPENNPKNCFSWFLSGDIARGRGEAHSISQMVEHAITRFGIDRRRVFVTGLSAGGAMASVMLATYPEVFAGGAVIAGLPYGCARSVQQAFDAMFAEQSLSGPALGDRVRAASMHRGPWPKISVWHGTADPIVKPSNSEHIVQQWVNVHGLSAAPSYQEAIGSHTRRVWADANGEALIEAFSITGMAHGVPLATTMGKDNCGAAGAFFLDAGISATRHIARFWRLGESLVESPRALSIVPQSHQIGTDDRAVAIAAERDTSEEALFDGNTNRDEDHSFDPNGAIAAAFKAAGLPVPELPRRWSAGTSHVAPGPIIEAALKAAGLVRR